MAHDPLASLRDLHLPPPPHDVFPAPGFIALWILLLLLITGMIVFFIRRHAQQYLKKQALKALHQAYDTFLITGRLDEASSAINILLKRVALAYYPRAQVASLQGEAWIRFLNQTGQNLHFEAVREELLQCPYQYLERTLAPPLREARLNPLLRLASTWIEQRGPHA